MAMTPEGKVKLAVKKWLKDRNVFWFCPVQNGLGVVGIPDFLCCFNGKFVAIETKAPGKKSNTTPNQQARIQEITDSGGVAIVVDNVKDLDALLVYL